MFGLSFAELAVIFIVALIVLGPDKLPEFARQFGKLTRSLKRQTDGLRREWYNAVYLPTQEAKQYIQQSEESLRNIGAEAMNLDAPAMNIDEDTCESTSSAGSTSDASQQNSGKDSLEEGSEQTPRKDGLDENTGQKS